MTENILISPSKQEIIYHRKSKGEELIIAPHSGLSLPPNRMTRVSKFSQLTENIEAELINDEIIARHTIRFEGEQDFNGMIILYDNKEEQSVMLLHRQGNGNRIVINPNNETQMTINKLKIFHFITGEGFIVCTGDNVEKTAIIYMVDVGHIGSCSNYEQRKIMTIRNLWPELGIGLRIKNATTDVSLGNIFNEFQPGIVFLRRQYNQELSIEQTHVFSLED